MSIRCADALSVPARRQLQQNGMRRTAPGAARRTRRCRRGDHTFLVQVLRRPRRLERKRAPAEDPHSAALVCDLEHFRILAAALLLTTLWLGTACTSASCTAASTDRARCAAPRTCTVSRATWAEAGATRGRTHRGARTCARRRRGGHTGEERVPGQHEPRDPHADERDPRHVLPGAAERARPAAAQLPPEGARLGRIAAGHHQRHPRLLQDRGRQAGPGGHSVRPRRRAGQPRQPARHEGRARRAWSCCSTCRRSCRRRWWAIRRGWARCCSTWATTPSSSPSAARSSLRCRCCRAATATSAQLRFEVRDTGIGMSPDAAAAPVPAVHRRPTPRPPAATAAPAWGWRSAGTWCA